MQDDPDAASSGVMPALAPSDCEGQRCISGFPSLGTVRGGAGNAFHVEEMNNSLCHLTMGRKGKARVCMVVL